MSDRFPRRITLPIIIVVGAILWLCILIPAGCLVASFNK